MKQIIIFFCLVFIIGCSSTPQDETSITQPVLLERYPLPAFPSAFDPTNFVLKLRMMIDENGNVNQVKLINSVGDNTWDSLAIRSVMHWRFTPALSNEKPVKIWVNQHVAIKIADPVYLSLAEILCDNFEDAAKVITALDKGQDFSELAVQVSTAPSKIKKGVLGKVDINNYCNEICEALHRIGVNEYTQPLKYGQKYVIFKRIEDILQ